MKKRRGRRGFWWWSWLLALATIGGTVGGFYMGEKQWDEAPKEYLSTATLSFHVRNPFVAAKGGVLTTTSTVADVNEAQVIRLAQSEDSLGEIATKLDLAKKLEIPQDEVVARLRSGIELDLTKEKDELRINATMNDPVIAAEVANAMAQAMPTLVKSADDRNKEEAMRQLEIESQPLVDQEFEALTALRKALEANNVNLDPSTGVDLKNFLLIPEVLTAKLEWDSAKDFLESNQSGQSEYRNYWAKGVKSSFTVAKAEVPPSFVGPALRPYQSRWSVYGLTAGMAGGVLLMLVGWKLLP